MPHMTKRIFSCLLACLMIFEIFLSVPPPSHAAGSPFDVKINQKDEKELGFKIFQGGDIHAQTAPSYPGFAFVRAYIEDKTNNDERVEVDHAELREFDTTNGMQKKVFFHTWNRKIEFRAKKRAGERRKTVVGIENHNLFKHNKNGKRNDLHKMSKGSYERT